MPPEPTKPLPSHRIGRKGLLLLFALVPLIYHPGLYDFALLPKRLLVQLVLTFIALVWVSDLRSGQVQAPRSSLLHLPIACYLLIMLLTFSQALNPVTGVVALAHQLTFACLFVLAFELFPLPSFPTLLRIAAGVGIAVSAIGILEARGVDQVWLPLSNGRPSATFSYRNFAATYLIMSLPFTMLLWLRSQTMKDLCLGAFATNMMLVFLIYTRTRGAWVGLAGSTLITLLVMGHARYHWKTRFGISDWLFKTPKARSLSLATLILALALSLLPLRIVAQQARLIDEKKVALLDALSFVTTPQADRGRLAMWRSTLSMIQDHPFLGVGPDNWRYLYPRYDKGAMLRADSEPRRPHNDFLWIASEQGLLGLAVYIWILGVAAWTVIRILKRAQNPDHAGYAVALGAALLAMLGHSMVSFPKERIETSFLFWLGLGLLARLDAPKARSRTPVLISETAWAVYLMPVLLILSVGLTYRHIQFDKHYLKALEFHKGNDFQSVLRESSLALKQGPFESQAFFLQGDGYQAHGSLQEASASYRAGLRYHPNAIQLLGGLGTTYALRNNLDRAEQYYRKALEIYPGYYQMYNNLGGVFQKRGNLDAAIQSYQKALEANQGYLDAYNNLGLAYLAAGRPDDAIQTYQKALLQTPKDAVLHYNLADAYYQKAQHDGSAIPQALASYERFLTLWTGSRSQAEPARKRVDELRKRLGGGLP